ncbi:beta-agarase [Novipirellula herctigrandis]
MADKDWPGITYRPDEQSRDMSRFSSIAVDVRNIGDHELTFAMRIDSLDSDVKEVENNRDSKTEQVDLAPGEKQTLRVTLSRKMPDRLKGRLIGMRSNPVGLNEEGGLAVDWIDQIILFAFKKPYAQTVEISNLRLDGEASEKIWFDDAVDPFPMIDTFGQYMHDDWPGKTHLQQELVQKKEQEQKDISADPAPTQWDTFGGYAAGPQFERSEHFRTRKYQGRWWLVDPEGYLFWSHGIDCVNSNNATTPITDREFYFADLPAKDSPLAVFYGGGDWAPHGYYEGRGHYKTFNFTGANLYRKYGGDWKAIFNRRCHERLRSWGLNTIANWSDKSIYRMNRTPYVVTSGTGGRRIEGSTGYWGKFPDPFDPGFAEATAKHMEYRREEANSTWCVGIFVDNELAWGDELSLAIAALQSPADQPAKIAFVKDLKAKYSEVSLLNEKWGTEYGSWDALLTQQESPDAEKAEDDLRAFYSHVADEYFRVCRDAVKTVAPETLYLGCRFAWVNDRAVRSAAKFCDVIGFNCYKYSVADYKLPDGVDMPAIIGEYHFGALDRGMFHTGLKPVENQQVRAEAYRSYLTGALKNPMWVGAHWFQYGDQATTGRGDGENYQIGFVDITDTPYLETIEASREIGKSMYLLRLQK